MKEEGVKAPKSPFIRGDFPVRTYFHCEVNQTIAPRVDFVFVCVRSTNHYLEVSILF